MSDYLCSSRSWRGGQLLISNWKEKAKTKQWMPERLGDVISGLRRFWNPEPILAGRSLCPELTGLPILRTVVCSASRMTGGV